jgi:putative endonuclease
LKWAVYILKCGDGSLYTGITNDLGRRMEAHIQGKGAKYTKGRGPLTLVYQEDFESRSAASRREIEIKKLSRVEKHRLLSV